MLFPLEPPPADSLAKSALELGMKTAWFVVQLKPNAHQLAERHLRRQGFDVFVPRRTVTRRHNGRFQSVIHPVFPGYSFVRFSAADGSARKVHSTRGVSRLVSLGGAYATLPDDMILELRAKFSADENEAVTGLSPGDRVRICKGPFADFMATIESEAPDTRIWVLLEFAGQTTRMKMHPGAVERL